MLFFLTLLYPSFNRLESIYVRRINKSKILQRKTSKNKKNLKKGRLIFGSINLYMSENFKTAHMEMSKRVKM